MEEIKRVIFAAGSGTSRAPMAAAIMKQMTEGKDIDVLARGVVVLFPEPMNQKTEAVLISNGIAPDNRYNIKRHELHWNGALTGSAYLNT